ncbi:MAG: DMT family transporter [Caulobacteraceae bacterium]
MVKDEDSTEERRTRADRLAEAPILLWTIMAMIAVAVVVVLFLLVLGRPAALRGRSRPARRVLHGAMTAADSEIASPARPRAGADYAALLGCSLIWGTTWFAITKQLGVVPPAVSVVYRFAIAAALYFGLCVIRRQPLGLSLRHHGLLFLQGLFTFAADYLFVYLAEGRVASAVVAVSFASLALVNLVVFRLALGQRGAPAAWAGAALGVAGVAVLSYGELKAGPARSWPWASWGWRCWARRSATCSPSRPRRRACRSAPGTAWAMAYGAAALAAYALVTGQPWRFEATPPTSAPCYIWR